MATVAALPAAPRVRGRNVLVATGFAVAGTIMYFAGLFGIYFQQRAEFREAGLEWIPGDAGIELTPPTMIMWTLIISCAVIQWAVYSIARDDRPHTLIALGATMAMGAMVIVQTAWQYTQMGLIADESRAGTLIYTLSISHLIMVIVGMAMVALMGFRALAGQYGSRQTDGIVSASIWWYAMTFIYFILWIGVFIAK
jgi:heme/copper-type cytochrome/quinol oxidase subunit 3